MIFGIMNQQKENLFITLILITIGILMFLSQVVDLKNLMIIENMLMLIIMITTINQDMIII